MSDNRPIGIMDSGLGGISVLKEAMRVLPEESFIFFGDNANAPYGSKSREEICRCVFAVAKQLMDCDAKAIVIACNTATSAAIDDVRAAFPVPVISMEPAIKPALAQSAGRILMLATPATCALTRYLRLKERLDGKGQVQDVPCTGWVECIESGGMDADGCMGVIAQTLRPFSGESIDGIVLGCTHFSLLHNSVAEYAQEHFRGERRIFDGSVGTVRHLREVLQEGGLCASGETPASLRLMTSGEEARYLPMMKRFLEE